MGYTPVDTNFPNDSQVQPVHVDDGLTKRLTSIINPMLSFTTVGSSGASTDAGQGNLTWDVSKILYLLIDFYVPTLGSGATGITISVDTLMPTGFWYHLATSTSIGALSGTFFKMGPGCVTNACMGSKIRISWTVQGTPTTATTFQVSAYGEY